MLPPTHTEIPLIQTSKKIKNVFTCDIVHSGILRLELFYTFQIKAITKCCILSFWLTRTSSICWICLWTCFQKWLYALRMLDIFKGWLDVDNCIWDNKIMAFLCFCLCQSRYVVHSPPKGRHKKNRLFLGKSPKLWVGGGSRVLNLWKSENTRFLRNFWVGVKSPKLDISAMWVLNRSGGWVGSAV